MNVMHKNSNQCRLCDFSFSKRFDLQIMGKYVINYYECLNCGSLQTELPYWLDEAYGQNNLSSLDTGAAQRNLHNLSACLAIAKLYNYKNIIDVGGGDGLLCRLLRDYQLNCFVKDRYSKTLYAQGFTEPNFKNTDLIIGFEVIEHLPIPKFDLDDLFNYNPKMLVITTDIYRKQLSDWWYLAPDNGQHVFFYSEKALNYIALKYNYKLQICGGYIIFMKNKSRFKNLILRIILKNKIVKLLRVIVALFPTPGVWKDHLVQIENQKKADSRTKRNQA